MRAADDPWLPDFCQAPTLFAAMLVAEGVVLAGWLVQSSTGFDVGLFALASLYAQWLTLLSCVALCLLKAPLRKLPPAHGATVALALVAALTLAGAAVVRWLDHALQTGLTGTATDLRFIATSTVLTVLFGALTLRYLHVQESLQATARREANARFDALQARIQPHFLFNTLNTVSGLIGKQPAKAEDALLDMADLLRAALSRDGGRVRLGEDLDLARRYLAIEQLRLGERLQVDWRIEDGLPLEMGVPSLTVQPLVENAVLHAISRLSGGGTLSLHARRDGRGITITIRNPLARTVAATGPGRTQANIRNRLRHALGQKARLAVSSDDGHYIVTLWLPIP